MKILLFGIWLSLSADASTTTYGINHRLVREALIPSQNVYVINSVIASEGVLTTKGLMKLNEKHPVMAKVLGVGMIAARSFVIFNNVEQLRKR